MVRLCPAYIAGVFGWTQHRLLDHRDISERFRQHRNRIERPHDHADYALSWHDPETDAVVCLDERRHGSAGAGGAWTVNRRSTDVANRPLPRWSLLRYPGWRIGCHLDALLLDFRPSRGIYPGPSRVCDRFRGDSRLLAQADFWLFGHGGSHRHHRLHQPRRMGST